MRLPAAVLALAFLFPSGAAAEGRPTLFERPIVREGVHFHFGVGAGVGVPGIVGFHHTMELGGTFANGVTVALLHTFTLNRGIEDEPNAPDLVGAWMAELKVPLLEELVCKVALGLGGEHDYADGVRIIPGFGWAYGLDLDFPVGPRHGPTLGLTFLHTLADGRHSFAAALGVGWTLF